MESTFELNSIQLARLLEVGALESGAEDVLQPDRAAAMLRDLLARPVSLDTADPDSFPAVLGRECGALAARAGETLGDLIRDPNAELAALDALKDYGKCLVRRAGSESERGAATALYYAAIAAALVAHRRKVTGHSYAKVEDGLARLEGETWIIPELIELFRKARGVCQSDG